MSITSILSKLLKRPILEPKIGFDLLSGRGNLDQDFPSDFTEEEKNMILPLRKFTMTSPERLVSLSRAVEHVVNNSIKGDIVECGVWKGGSMMLIAKKLRSLGDTNRILFLFDTYEGMSDPTEKDVSAVDKNTAKDLLDKADKNVGDNVWCYSPMDEVKSNLSSTGYPTDKLHFVKGKVEDTIPHSLISDIAILRLDTDWYESTKHEMENLYDRLVPGGVLIIDDYGHWSGSKKAVDEFIANRKLNIFLNRIDYTGRLAIKS